MTMKNKTVTSTQPIKSLMFIAMMSTFGALSGCDSKQAQDHPVQDASVNHQAGLNKQDEMKCKSVQALLNDIYMNQIKVTDLNNAQLKHYFSDELVQLISKDNQCRADINGICNLEFNIFTDSQEFKFQNYDLNRLSKSQRYEIVMHAHNEQSRVEIEMTDSHCPKIANIYYKEGNLKHILSN